MWNLRRMNREGYFVIVWEDFSEARDGFLQDYPEGHFLHCMRDISRGI